MNNLPYFIEIYHFIIYTQIIKHHLLIMSCYSVRTTVIDLLANFTSRLTFNAFMIHYIVYAMIVFNVSSIQTIWPKSSQTPGSCTAISSTRKDWLHTVDLKRLTIACMLALSFSSVSIRITIFQFHQYLQLIFIFLDWYFSLRQKDDDLTRQKYFPQEITLTFIIILL